MAMGKDEWAQATHSAAGDRGLAASPATQRWDWGLKSRPTAGTGPGLGTRVPADDWDWH